jgi:hypothetical protein
MGTRRAAFTSSRERRLSVIARIRDAVSGDRRGRSAFITVPRFLAKDLKKPDVLEVLRTCRETLGENQVIESR